MLDAGVSEEWNLSPYQDVRPLAVRDVAEKGACLLLDAAHCLLDWHSSDRACFRNAYLDTGLTVSPYD